MKAGLRASWLARGLLAAGSAILALGLAELTARYAIESPPFTDFILAYPGGAPKYTLDREIGYVPRIADPGSERGYAYDLYGINVDQSIRLDQGSPRILCLGDSVTRRGHLLRALDAAYKGNHWQFLNAGVEGYDVVQEVAYFFRYARNAAPDRIFLSIHNNDFTYFPMTYLRSPDEIFWYFPGEPPLLFRRSWFKASHLYRAWVAWEYLRILRRAEAENKLPSQSRASLAELRDWSLAHHVKLQAVVLPILRPYAEWSDVEKQARRTALAITNELGIETYDLLPPLEAAFRDGKTVREGVALDFWHPNEDSAGYFARYLKEKGLFSKVPVSFLARPGAPKLPKVSRAKKTADPVGVSAAPSN